MWGGRQPRILVNNFWMPRSIKHERVPLPGFMQTWQSRVITFFRINTSLCLFSFQGQTTLLVLWIFTSNISPHFAEFAGMKFEDHKRNVDTNRFVSEIH